MTIKFFLLDESKERSHGFQYACILVRNLPKLLNCLMQVWQFPLIAELALLLTMHNTIVYFMNGPQ